MKKTEFVLNIPDVSWAKKTEVIIDLFKMSPLAYKALYMSGASKTPVFWKDNEVELIKLSKRHKDLKIQLFAYEDNRKSFWLKEVVNGKLTKYEGNEAHRLFYTEYKEN